MKNNMVINYTNLQVNCGIAEKLHISVPPTPLYGFPLVQWRVTGNRPDGSLIPHLPYGKRSCFVWFKGQGWGGCQSQVTVLLI